MQNGVVAIAQGWLRIFYCSNEWTTVVAFPFQYIHLHPTSNLSCMDMDKLSLCNLILLSWPLYKCKMELWLWLRVGSGYSIVAMNGQLLWIFFFNIYTCSLQATSHTWTWISCHSSSSFCFHGFCMSANVYFSCSS